MEIGKLLRDETEEDQYLINIIKELKILEMDYSNARETLKTSPNDFYAGCILKKARRIDDAYCLNLLSLYSNPKDYIAWYSHIYDMKNIKSGDEIIKDGYNCIEMFPEEHIISFNSQKYAHFLSVLAAKDNDEITKTIKLEIGKNLKDFCFFNGVLAHKSLVCSGMGAASLNQNFIDPVYLSARLISHALENNIWYNQNQYYVKVYANSFTVRIPILPKSLSITLNGKELHSGWFFIEKSFAYKLKYEDKLCINDKRVDLNRYGTAYEDLQEKLCDYEEDCVFYFLEHLKYVSNISTRERMIERLTALDPKRKCYYKSLLHEYYYVAV